MPTYEYECKTCGYYYEKNQSITENPDTQCPQCGGLVKRLISGGTGVIFKGSGFYVTDSKKNNPASSSIKKNQECSKQDNSCSCCSTAKETA